MNGIKPTEIRIFYAETKNPLLIAETEKDIVESRASMPSRT